MPFARPLRRGGGTRALALALFVGACSRAPLAATTVENAAGVHAPPAAANLGARQRFLDPALIALEAEAGTTATLEPRLHHRPSEWAIRPGRDQFGGTDGLGPRYRTASRPTPRP